MHFLEASPGALSLRVSMIEATFKRHKLCADQSEVYETGMKPGMKLGHHIVAFVRSSASSAAAVREHDQGHAQEPRIVY